MRSSNLETMGRRVVPFTAESSDLKRGLTSASSRNTGTIPASREALMRIVTDGARTWGHPFRTAAGILSLLE